jgi:hypothetical protein
MRSPSGGLMCAVVLPMLRGPMDRFLEERTSVVLPGNPGGHARVCARSTVCLGASASALA